MSHGKSVITITIRYLTVQPCWTKQSAVPPKVLQSPAEPCRVLQSPSRGPTQSLQTGEHVGGVTAVGSMRAACLSCRSPVGLRWAWREGRREGVAMLVSTNVCCVCPAVWACWLLAGPQLVLTGLELVRQSQTGASLSLQCHNLKLTTSTTSTLTDSCPLATLALTSHTNCHSSLVLG